MKKKYTIQLLVLFALTLMGGLGTAPCLAAGKGETKDSLHRDGSAFVKEGRVLQADRQQAAERAKAKGFQLMKVGAPENPKNTAPNKKEAKNG